MKEFTTLDTARIAEEVGFKTAPNQMGWTMLHKITTMVHEEAMREVEAMKAQRDELLDAIHSAATSLETISRLAGKSVYLGDDGERIPTYMEHHDEVRGYAFSRATVARATIAKVKGAT